jgi:hypothetical protein
MPSTPSDAAPPAGRTPTPRRHQRRVSRTRQAFLSAINAQITGTRVLAIVVLIVCLAGGVYWLTGTTGSPVVGAAFIALALVLSVTVYAFIQVMYMFTGKR